MARKVHITNRALVQRINRKLSENDEVLKAARGTQMQLDVGEFYVVNVRINGVTEKDVDPEKLGRELGVLKPWEAVA